MEPGWFRQSGSLLCFDIDKVCVGMECSFQACTCAGLFRYMHKDATDTDVSPCSFFPITTDCYTYVSFTRQIQLLLEKETSNSDMKTKLRCNQRIDTVMQIR